MYQQSAVSVGVRPVPLPAQPCADDLVRTHVKLVHRLARQTFARFSSAIAIEDLVGIGQIALIEAARGPFVDRGDATFATYATIRVRGAMIDKLRKLATITRDSMRNRRRFDHARQNLQNQLGRPPTDAEMAENVDMAVDAYRAARVAATSIQYSSIDDSYSDHDAWFADESPDAFAVLAGARQKDTVAKAVAQLPEREQVILQLYYVEETSLQDIGKIFGVGPARICQIKKAALSRLRTSLNGRVDSVC